MAKRIWAASFVILGTGLMLASDVSAGGHRGPAGHGALQAPVGKTVARARATHAFKGAGRLHHRHFGLPLTGWWTNGWYGGAYDPSNDTMLHDGPALAYDRPAFADTVPSYPPVYSGGPYPAPYAPAPARRPLDVIVYRPGCSSETQTVLWSDGKDRTITMVRC
jgi:hypothetical protein